MYILKEEVIMKKALIMMLTLVMVMSLFAACGKDDEAATGDDNATTDGATTDDTTTDDGAQDETSDDEAGSETSEGTFEDGSYYAEEDAFNNGWKGAVILTVEGGKITDAYWTGISESAGADKYVVSQNGGYPMVANGGAQAEWYEQADLTTAHLIETQDPTAVEYKDEEGHTDAISGVSIHVKDFYELVDKALANGPQEKGSYKDGAYHAESAEFQDGWKQTFDATVLFGNIVAVNWNAISEEDPELDKKTASIEGTYGMDGEQGQWHEQAARAEAYLLETQDPAAIEYSDEEGHTDAISGVSIHVNGMYDLAQEALAEAK